MSLVLFSVAIIIALCSIAAPSWADTGSAGNYPAVTLWPLAYHQQVEDHARTDILYPVFHYKREGSYSRFAVRPFLYNLEKDSAKDFRQLNVLWPLTHFESEGDRLKRYIFPFYYQSRNDPEFSLHVWPFYGHSLQSDGTESWSTLYPFFQYHRNEAQVLRKIDYFWPLGRSLMNAETSSNYLFPFWWNKKAPGISGRFVFPYFMYETETSRQDAIIPVWYRLRTPREKKDLILPIWYAQSREHSRFRTLFPLYWNFEDGPERQLSLFVPVYGRYRNHENDYQSLFPFYFRHTNLALDSEFRYYFPLYGQYRKGEDIRHSYYLFPIYAHIEDETVGREAWYFLWPLIYRDTRPDSSETWAVPFYWSKNTSEREFRVALIPPYYRNTNLARGSEFRYYFPFYGYYRGGESVQHSYYLFPLYAHIEEEAVGREAWHLLWPLIYRESRGDSSETRVFPLYWSKKKPEREFRAALIPPYYFLEEKDGRKAVHLWPFYGLNQDQSYAERSIAWPLFRWGSDPAGGQRAWQFLLLYRKVEPQRDMLGLFPLWHYDRKAERTRNVSLLHWQEKTADMNQLSLLHAMNPDWSLFSIKNEKTARRQHLFPFYSYTEKKEDGQKTLYVLGPIYRYQQKNEESTEHHFLWKVFYSEKSVEKKEAGFLWRLIRSKQDAEGSLFEFNPFYYSEKRSNGETFSSWIGGIYAVRSDATGERRRLFWLLNW
ncbi:MAG: hypothetical protein IBX47_10245 [Desulfuromonadales bacterium]|nr:hypothetical protein [Desulfuromonadales bacterium]